MITEMLQAHARVLFCVCAASAAMEALGRDERATAPFHAVCALSVAVYVLRGIARLLE